MKPPYLDDLGQPFSLLTWDSERQEHMKQLIERLVRSAGPDGLHHDDLEELVEYIDDMQVTTTIAEMLFQGLMDGTLGVSVDHSEGNDGPVWGPLKP